MIGMIMSGWGVDVLGCCVYEVVSGMKLGSIELHRNEED